MVLLVVEGEGSVVVVAISVVSGVVGAEVPSLAAPPEQAARTPVRRERRKKRRITTPLVSDISPYLRFCSFSDGLTICFSGDPGARWDTKPGTVAVAGLRSPPHVG
jgi:hypothetical protein